MIDPSSPSIRVVIVDDHEVVRQGLRRVLETDGKIKVVGEANNGAEAINIILAETPDVIIMDLKMPDMDGITATRIIKQKNPQIHVLILTMFADNYFEEAIEAGCSGYLLKDGDSSKIREAVIQIRDGINPISPALNKKLMTGYYMLHKKGMFSLTERQTKILSLICDGVDSDEICLHLGISLSTEKRELREIYSILGANSRTHAVAVAIKQGLLPQKLTEFAAA